MRDVYVIGVHTTRFGKYLDLSIKDLARQTLEGCIADAGIMKKDIQAVWFSNSGWGELGQSCIRGQVALRPAGIGNIPVTNVENACAGASTAFHHAWLGVASGLYDMTMAIGAEKLYRRNTKENFAQFLTGIDFENVKEIISGLNLFAMSNEEKARMEEFIANHAPEKSTQGKRRKPFKEKLKEFKDSMVVLIRLGEILGYRTTFELARLAGGDHSPFMDIYGYNARLHMKKYGSTIEQLAAIASKSHFNSTLNPNAQYRFEVPVEKVLSDRMISYPLTRSMCAPIGDGSASAILCSGDVVKRLGLAGQAVRIRASILGSGSPDRPYGLDYPEIGERLSKLAYETSGIGPGDVNAAEVHDATAYGELRQAENLGFCAYGEGGALAERGETRLTGRIPINPSGGLLSRGHPVGASGLAQIHELVTQLRGRADKRQIENCRIALAENGGGALGSEEAAMCIHILEAPSKDFK